MPSRRRLDIEAEMIECRTFGHAWERYHDMDLPRPRFGWRESLRCVRCSTSRHDVVDANGTVAQRTYDYPDDYRYTADALPTRSEFRVLLHRLDKRRLKVAG